MSTLFPRFATLALAASASLLPGQQQHAKVQAPLPPVDLDRKLDVAPAPAARTTAKTGPATAMPPAGNGISVTRADGERVQPTLPANRLLFDAAADGAVLACADTYKARVAADGFTYVPFFGSDAPRNYPLTFVLENARLGSMPAPLTQAAPRRDGSMVTVDRGAVQERYEFTPTSVEQEFVLAQPFTGDLALTLRVDSELRGSRDGDGLRFGNELGHVSYTAAILVDAVGRRVPMLTDYAAGAITLRAPAATLADLAFPVIVDPILTTRTVATEASLVLRHADTAFSNTAGDYLVVYEYVYSAADSDLYAVAVTAGGTLVANSLTTVDGSTDSWSSPRVASSGDNFLVVASVLSAGGGARAIWGRLRAVGSNTQQGKFPISGNEQGDKVYPDVGGEYDAPVHFCVVWQRNYTATDHDIHYRIVSNTGSGMSPIQYLANASSADDFQPRIGKCDGPSTASAQFWPVVWHRFNGADNDIYGARIHWNGVVGSQPFLIDGQTHNDVQPSVSSPTDALGGTRYWMVVYASDYSPARGLDLYARVFTDAAVPVQVVSKNLHDAEGLSGTEVARDQMQPQVDTDGCRFTVAYLEAVGANDHDVVVSTVGIQGNALRGIDVRVAAGTSASETFGCSLAAKRSGGGSKFGYAIVFDLNSASEHKIETVIYSGLAPTGGLTVRPTGCSGLTISTANGSQLPAPGQTLRYDIGGAIGPSFFLVGWPVVAMNLCPQRSCALGVNPFGYLLVPGGTLQLAVPCATNLVGGTVSVQGGALGAAAGCSEFANLAVTDTVDAKIR